MKWNEQFYILATCPGSCSLVNDPLHTQQAHILVGGRAGKSGWLPLFCYCLTIFNMYYISCVLTVLYNLLSKVLKSQDEGGQQRRRMQLKSLWWISFVRVRPLEKKPVRGASLPPLKSSLTGTGKMSRTMFTTESFHIRGCRHGPCLQR